MNTNKTDFRLSQVEATLGFEGLALDESTRELLRQVADGEVSQARADLLSRHRPALLTEVIDNG